MMIGKESQQQSSLFPASQKLSFYRNKTGSSRSSLTDKSFVLVDLLYDVHWSFKIVCPGTFSLKDS
jgi:hypothetical protein